MTEDESWQWYRESEITSDLIKARATGNTQFTAMAPTSEDRKRLLNKITSSGLCFSGTKENSFRFINDRGKVPIVIRYPPHEAIFRGIAKIAFNYLASCEGAAFVLNRDFDRIRNYIRCGEEIDMTKPGFVYVMDEPILTEERIGYRVTDGHLLRLQWESFNVLTCSVSLFNVITYKIVLCRGYRGIWHEIAIGHLFDVETKAVSQLFVSRGSP